MVILRAFALTSLISRVAVTRLVRLRPVCLGRSRLNTDCTAGRGTASKSNEPDIRLAHFSCAAMIRGHEAKHHGAHQGVTGSCHQLFWQNDRSLLVDCGIFQGDEAKKNPSPEINFSLRGIESLLLTHVHIDHAGRIPYLIAAGFDKPIYCSGPTARLLPLVMEDALKIGFTRSRKLIKRFLSHIGKLLRPLKYNQWHSIDSGIKLRLRPAGHVLGSTIFEVQLANG